MRDAIGRRWQLSTIQYDFNLPERFDLEYVGADNERHQPVMIHRALFGSIERFFGVLIEHFAGAFPAWLAPVQARVLPVATAHEAYAAEVVARLQGEGFRVDSVDATDPLGKRIRAAKLEKLPYVLVVGRRRRRRRDARRQPARRRGRARRARRGLRGPAPLRGGGGRRRLPV